MVMGQRKTALVQGPSPDHYYVRAHYRRKPGKAQPRWAALVWDDGAWWAYAGRQWWTQDLGKTKLYLKNELKKHFKEEIEVGVVVLVRLT